jgi:hypothetical protein
MADGKVVVPPDSSGKAIDTSELTRSDGTVVERQRVVIGDPITAGNFLAVGSDGSLTVGGGDQIEYLVRIEVQLKRVARLLEILAGQHIPLDQVF